MKIIIVMIAAALLSSCAAGVTGSVANTTVGAKVTVAKDGVVVGGAITATNN